MKNKLMKSAFAALAAVTIGSTVAPVVSAASENNGDNSETQTFVVPTTTTNIYWSNYGFDENKSLDSLSQEFDSMSVDELNQYIDSTIRTSNMYSDSKASGVIVEGTRYMWKTLWIAAAAIAKKVGYPCSGTLVEYSAKGKNYSEWSRGGGLIASRIKTNKDYKVAKKRKLKSFTFHKSNSKDLFYALHKVSSNFNYTKKHPTHISDRFDFKEMKGNGFTVYVNNWANLCQHMNVLYNSKVNIYF